MNYDQFKELVQKEFMSFLPEKYQHLQMNIQTVERVNKTVDSISFIDADKESVISPIIYMDNMFDIYEKSGNYLQVFRETAERVGEAFENLPVKACLNLDNVKNRIMFQLINTEQNKEMLRGMPHREFLDLSVIYRLVNSFDEEGLQSVMIKNDLMERLELSEEQLYERATKDCKQYYPATIRSMNEIMKPLLIAEGMTKEMVEEAMPELPADETIWVISNYVGINGAAAMLYSDTLQEVAEIVGTDLYILPSSLHEVLAISVNMGDPAKLAGIVEVVNMGDVLLEERLSNQIYHYDKDLRKLSMATNTPYKRLDGKSTEQVSFGAYGMSR